VLSARATDVVGNVGESVPIVIGVDEDPMPLPSADSSGSGGDGGTDDGTEGGTDALDDDGTGGGLPQGDDARSGGDDGCGCAQDRGAPHAAILLIPFVLRRRRRR
jgi:hypothetical protein